MGNAGTSGPTGASNAAGTRGRCESIPSVRTPRSEATELQRQAEEDGIETLAHKERWRVACRLLVYGWQPAWEWFKSHFGADFKPGLTREMFRSVIEAFPDDYDHVKVPEKPA